jgi:hypothetical protein
MRSIRALTLIALTSTPLSAQTIDDGFLMSKRVLATGVVYSRDSWGEYWEGSRKRANENIGTLTTQTLTLASHYGVTDRLSIIAMVPYVWTHSTQGTLHGMRGLQDLTLAAKYRLLSSTFTSRGTLSAVVGGAASIPLSDYTPDFLPLSIGSASRRFSGRLTVAFESHASWFISGSAAHTWRNTVTLDRPAYYTNGQLFLTDEVWMPRVTDYVVSAGYRKGRLYVPVSLTEQRTLGGGDIRRQDMPFVSNRMNFTKVDASVIYALDVPKVPAVRLGVSQTVRGRNVGQSTTITSGLLYTFAF